MLLTFKVSLCVFVLLFLAITINADLPGEWPKLDTPPPPKAEWTSLVDQSKVPDDNCTQCGSDITQCPNKYDWALTFDDGPTIYTDTLLDYLSSKQIKLTFFVVGSRVVENPQVLKKAFEAGHQIGVHTWSHTSLISQTNEEIIAEIKWTELIIQQVIGVTPKYMRPPYGDINGRVRGVLSQLGYTAVIWDKDTSDYKSVSNKNFQLEWIEGNFTEWVKEDDPTGHISLEHDLNNQTAGRAPIVVPIVQNAGFTIKSVAACLGENPYSESQPAPNTTVTISTPVASSSTPVASSVVTITTVTVATPTNDPKGPAAVPPTPGTDGSTDSSAISYMNDSNNLLLLVLFIVGSYFT